jgi:hypothetical protein
MVRHAAHPYAGLQRAARPRVCATCGHGSRVSVSQHNQEMHYCKCLRHRGGTAALYGALGARAPNNGGGFQASNAGCLQPPGGGDRNCSSCVSLHPITHENPRAMQLGLHSGCPLRGLRVGGLRVRSTIVEPVGVLAALRRPYAAERGLTHALCRLKSLRGSLIVANTRTPATALAPSQSEAAVADTTQIATLTSPPGARAPPPPPRSPASLPTRGRQTSTTCKMFARGQRAWSPRAL